MKKLDIHGFSHDIVIVLFVVIFAIGGVGYMVASRADDCGGSVSDATSSAVTPNQSVSSDVSSPVTGSNSNCAVSDSTSSPTSSSTSSPVNSPTPKPAPAPVPQPQPSLTPPNSLVAINVTQTNFRLQFQPGSANHDTITGYNIYRFSPSTSSTSASLVQQVAATNQYAIISGLQPGIIYDFYIKSFDSAGLLSAPSTTLAVNTAKATSQSATLSISPLSMIYSHPGIVGNGKSYSTMYWNSYGTAKINEPGTPHGLQVVAKGDQCNGAPSMTVSIDGRLEMMKSVSSTTFTTYNGTISGITPGMHQLTLAFLNDYFKAGQCDRNLYVQAISLTN